ncbi:LysR substrate-binding domain-containing protein [Streptomyces cellulosae]
MAAYPVVCSPPGSGLRAVLDQACGARGAGPAVALEASAADAVAGLAARGLGVAVLSDSMADAYRDRLTAHVIADAHVPALLALVRRPARNPALCALLTHCRRAFGANTTGPGPDDRPGTRG